MEKEIYLVTVEKLVLLQKSKPVQKAFVTKDKLIKLLEGNYIVYEAKLIDQEKELEDPDVLNWL